MFDPSNFTTFRVIQWKKEIHRVLCSRIFSECKHADEADESIKKSYLHKLCKRDFSGQFYFYFIFFIKHTYRWEWERDLKFNFWLTCWVSGDEDGVLTTVVIVNDASVALHFLLFAQPTCTHGDVWNLIIEVVFIIQFSDMHQVSHHHHQQSSQTTFRIHIIERVSSEPAA